MRRLCTSTAAPTALARLLGNFEVRTAAQSYRTTITPDWMQGQTTYGGLSAALCLEGARRALSGDGAVELPPLRSALICFVGAAGGPVDVDCNILRRGKGMSFVEAAVLSDGKDGKATATTGTFAFGAPRLKSNVEALRLMTLPPKSLPPPEECSSIFSGFPSPGEGVLFPPIFTQHTESMLASGPKPGSAASTADQYVWVRWKGANVATGGAGPDVSPDVSLLALADVIPPASAALFAALAPVSSVTWQVNLIDAEPRSFDGGYFLMRTRAEHAKHGHTSQDMELWGPDGIVAISRQSVAIYA